VLRRVARGGARGVLLAGATGREGGQGGANYRPEGSSSFGEYSVFDCAWRPPLPPPPPLKVIDASRGVCDIIWCAFAWGPQAGPRERGVRLNLA
jgi:hypothetical protein